MCPNPMTGVLKKEGDLHTEKTEEEDMKHKREFRHEDEGRDWSDESTSQRTPRIVGDEQRLGRPLL